VGLEDFMMMVEEVGVEDKEIEVVDGVDHQDIIWRKENLRNYLYPNLMII